VILFAILFLGAFAEYFMKKGKGLFEEGKRGGSAVLGSPQVKHLP
jgi:hypothetical protein